MDEKDINCDMLLQFLFMVNDPNFDIDEAIKEFKSEKASNADIDKLNLFDFDEDEE